MKKLKFMLAAATALGLASASQAEDTLEYLGSTNFEDFNAGATVDSSLNTLFDFTGTAGDNESTIVEESYTPASAVRLWANAAHTKHLKVSTGTDPLLRKIKPAAATVPENGLYIDTLVQFTVTPYSDTVTATASDKLMIYLAEATNAVGEVTGTNLTVKAGMYTPGEDPLDPSGGGVEAVDVPVSAQVLPGTWYRLTVKSSVNDGLLVFNIWLDGTQLTTSTFLYGNDNTAFPSLLGKDSTTIAAVGFAGEGAVDDIAFTTADPFATPLDFTLTLGTGVSGVSFTIDGHEYTAAGQYTVYADSEIELGQIAYAEGYMAGTAPEATGLELVNGTYAVSDTTVAGTRSLALSAAALPVVATVSGVTSSFANGVYTFTAPTGYVIGSLLVNGDLVAAAAGQTSYDWTAVAGADVVVAATKPLTAAEHPWYENPKAEVLAEDLPYEGSGKPSAFHGQGQEEYLGLTYGTNPLQFDLFTVDGTNALTTVTNVAAAGVATPGFRGVAISKTLGIAMTMAYATTTTMYAFPLDGSTPTAVTKPATHSFDAGAFSPDGKYFFSNALNGEGDNKFYVKWAVSKENGTVTLTKVGSITANGRGRNLAYARIKGRDLVFALADAGKIAVIDMTGDTVGSWTTTDMITDLPTHSYGSLCVSGINATGATPTLTVATSVNNDTSPDVLNVYTLTVPASGAVTATPAKSFNQTEMTAAGFGTAPAHGNTVYVTDDNATIYFGRADRKLYAAVYAAPAPTGEDVEPGQQSTATYETQAAAEAALANVTIAASEAVTNALDAAAQETYLAKFEKKVVEADGVYKIEVGLTTAAVAALQTEVDADAAEVIEDLDSTTVTLTTTPGFYYSFEYGTTLDNMAEVGTRTLATGTTLELTRPTTTGATAGFYKVLVNIVPSAPAAQD